MGFEFQSHAVEVEVCGEKYTVNLGDSKLLDEVTSWNDELQKKDYSKLSGDQMQALESDVDRYITALLGTEQWAAIQTNVGRKLDVLDKMELFAYLFSEVNGEQLSQRLTANLKRYMPELPIGL